MKQDKYPKLICLDVAVCSSWGRRLSKHIFKTQYAQKNGHRYCLNCGMTKLEARQDDGSIETRVVDYHSDLEKPTYLTQQDIKNKNYRIFI